MPANSNGRERGSSIIELVVVSTIVITLSAIAIMSTVRPTTTNRANAAVDAVVSTLRQARQTAIATRRNVAVYLLPPNQIQLVLQTLPGEPAATPIALVKLNDGITTGLQFYLFPTLPNTPMGPLGFGKNAAIDYEPVNGGPVGGVVMFSSSGSFVGSGGVGNLFAVGNNNPVNTTIYIGQIGDATTARAITVVGATGRVRSYAWNGTAWQE